VRVAPERSQLTGPVEVDETYVGGQDAGRRGGRDSLGTAAIVVVAIEVPGAGSGQIRMYVLEDLSADSLCGFVRDNVASGATVSTDARQGYRRLARLGYDHQPRSQRAGRPLGEDVGKLPPRVHRAISNLKSDPGGRLSQGSMFAPVVCDACDFLPAKAGVVGERKHEAVANRLLTCHLQERCHCSSVGIQGSGETRGSRPRSERLLIVRPGVK